MPKIIPFALLAIVVVGLAQLPPSADVAWQLSVGHRLSEGAELYRDIIEINPPLWFWLAAPIVQVAAWFHISGTTALIGFLALCAAVSLLLTRPLIDERFPLIGTVMVLAFFITGISATGEREQFTLIAVTPYVLLCAARVGGRTAPLWLAIIIGVWAGFGLCLKPFFVVVPLALQAWVYFQTRRVFVEFVVIVAVGVAYCLAVALIHPEYLAVLQMAARYYSTYNVGPITMLLIAAPAVVFVSIGLLLTKPNEETTALAIAGLAFLAAYLMQIKGFRYQSLPALGFLAMIAMLNLKSRAVIPMMLTLLFTFATTTLQTSQRDPDAERAVADLKPGASVLIATAYSTPAWPMVEERGLRWSSPYIFLWMRDNRRLTNQIVERDIAREPDRVVIDDRLSITPSMTGYSPGPVFGHFATFTKQR